MSIDEITLFQYGKLRPLFRVKIEDKFVIGL